MTPSRALAEAVRDVLRDKVPLRKPHCDNQINGQPPARSGQYYVAVYPTGFVHGGSGDQHLGIDRRLGVTLGITQRTGVCPDDRMYREAIEKEPHGALVLAQVCDRVMRLHRYQILAAANAKLEPSDVWDGKLVEPLRLGGTSLQVRAVGPQHFKAKPCSKGQEHNCQDFGAFVELPYGECRYVESFVGVAVE